MGLLATLLVAGAVLLVLETILPGLIAGLGGVACLLAAVWIAYADFGARAGNAVLLIVITGLLAGIVLYLKYFPTSRMARMFVSHRAIGTVGGEQIGLLHAKGVAFTTLRPSGSALINGRRVDVVTEGGFVEKDSPLEVIAVEGMRIVVRPIS